MGRDNRRKLENLIENISEEQNNENNSRQNNDSTSNSVSNDNKEELLDPEGRITPNKFEIKTGVRHSELVVQAVNSERDQDDVYNSNPIKSSPSAFELGQFMPALNQYTWDAQSAVEHNTQTSHISSKYIPDEIWNWDKYQDIRNVNTIHTVGAIHQIPASILQSYNIPWVVKYRLGKVPAGLSDSDYVTYVGIPKNCLDQFIDGLEKCYQGFENPGWYKSGFKFIDFEFESEDYGFIPSCASFIVLDQVGVLKKRGRNGASTDSPTSYEDLEWVADWKQY